MSELIQKKKIKVFKNKKIKKIINLIYKFRQAFKSGERNPLVKLCLKILNQKLQTTGVLGSNQCLSSKCISENDILKRGLITILKNKLKIKNNNEILKLIRNEKIFLKNSLLISQNVFLTLESERNIEINI